MAAHDQLTEDQKRHLRGLAHRRKPVVQLGARGLTESVLAEIERAIDHHELIKIRLNAGDHDQRVADVERICRHTGAALVQRVGNVACLYRPHPEKPGIALPT